jgi:ABC-type glycerol-3-phosphate transport system permease component
LHCKGFLRFSAYGPARFRVPFGRSILIILIATIIFPRFVMLVPIYALFVKIGWVGTWLPLIVPLPSSPMSSTPSYLVGTS